MYINDRSIDLTVDGIFSSDRDRDKVFISVTNGEIKISQSIWNMFTFETRQIVTRMNRDLSLSHFDKPRDIYYLGKNILDIDVFGSPIYEKTSAKNAYKCPVCGEVNDKLLLNINRWNVATILCDECLSKAPYIIQTFDHDTVIKISNEDNSHSSFEGRLFRYGTELFELAEGDGFVNGLIIEHNSNINSHLDGDVISRSISRMTSLIPKPDLESRLDLS